MDWEAQAVLARLPLGRDAAIRLDALTAALGASWDRRTVKRAIQSLREQGKPVATGNEGAWLATAPADLDAYLDRSRSQIHAMWRTYRAVRRTQRRMREGEQLPLGLVA